MNILIVGNGGREHALAWKIQQSPACGKVFVAPGNAGTSEIAVNLDIATDDFIALGAFCISNEISLIIVGPEGPLVAGIRDHFENDPTLKHLLLVGPGSSGARLEGSKDFSKQFMVRHGIPTAKAMTFDVSGLSAGLKYLESCKTPIVLKADGLAAGKGVIIAATRDEAAETLREMLEDRKFGDASARVLIEEFLDGIELSVFVLTDGKDYVVLPEAKDYKRVGEADTGPNTGGMGAISPVVFADKIFMQKVEDRIIKPTISGLKKENIAYRGFIFIGLISVQGEPYVIEYNARMGDPETQAVMPRITNDFLDLLVAAARGTLVDKRVEQNNGYTVAVSLVSGGYPGHYEKGNLITGLKNETDALVFHAGTRISSQKVVTDGGRVLTVTGHGKTLQAASDMAYLAISEIGWEGLYFRKDIGVDLQKLINK